MRISEIIASLIPKVRPIQPTGPVAEPNQTGKVYSRPDAVELSGESQLLSRLTNEMKKLPQTDEARVNELKAKIESGDYDPSAKDIAAKILGIDSE